jgi:hypothetical protein
MWIAHEQVIKDETTEQAIGTKIQLQGKDTADVIMAHVDGNFYMAKRINKETGVVEFGILTDKVAALDAGYRQPKNAERLPTFIINPVWSEIFSKLGYNRK